MISCNSDKNAEETNLALVKNYFKAINSGDTLSVDNLVSANFTKINNDKLSDKKGYILFKESIKSHIKNNKVYKFIIEDIIAGNNKVTVRWQWESINIKPGGEKPVISKGISIFEIQEGKIDKLWQAFDLLGFNNQLEIN